MTANAARLTLGPVLFNWPAEHWRDFYFRIADEAPVDIVYLGEVVCSKRQPFFDPHLPAVIERLQRAGKAVRLSTLALVMNRREQQAIHALVRDLHQADETTTGPLLQESALTVEVNDLSALMALREPVAAGTFCAGPFLNIYNEASLQFLADLGIHHCSLPPELPRTALEALGAAAAAQQQSLEVYVHGRVPLALSARCYHARVHGLDKVNCQFVCDQDPDGLAVRTLDDEDFLTVNGIQTLSHGCLNLIDLLPDLQQLGISHFRISPQSRGTMTALSAAAGVLTGKLSPGAALETMQADSLTAPYCNGFYHGLEGARWVSAEPVRLGGGPL